MYECKVLTSVLCVLPAAALAEPRPGEEEGFIVTTRPSYFVRLGKLSAKVRERALEQSLIRAHKARDTTHAAVTQMTSTMDLLESARVTLASANQQLGGAPEQLLQRWKEWKEGQPKELQEKGTAETEMDTAKDKEEVQFVYYLECNAIYVYEYSYVLHVYMWMPPHRSWSWEPCRWYGVWVISWRRHVQGLCPVYRVSQALCRNSFWTLDIQLENSRHHWAAPKHSHPFS